MNLDANALLLSLLVSSVGFVFFSYGRKQRRAPQVIGGLILMIYPYFVSNLVAQALIGCAVVALIWGALHLGV